MGSETVNKDDQGGIKLALIFRKGVHMVGLASKQRTKKVKRKINWKHALPFYMMVLPGLIYLLINNYMPMFGIIIAFKKLNFSKGIFGSE